MINSKYLRLFILTFIFSLSNISCFPQIKSKAKSTHEVVGDTQGPVKRPGVVLGGTPGVIIGNTNGSEEAGFKVKCNNDPDCNIVLELAGSFDSNCPKDRSNLSGLSDTLYESCKEKAVLAVAQVVTEILE